MCETARPGRVEDLMRSEPGPAMTSGRASPEPGRRVPGPVDSAARRDGSGPPGEPRPPGDSVSPWIRWAVRLFLAAFVICGVFGLENWPLTGFRLFSHLRGERASTWQADRVSPAGRAVPVPFPDLPRAYQGFGLVMQTYRSLPPATRHATCEAWLAEVRRALGPARSLRLYHVTWDLLPRRGDRPRNVTRTEVDACS
jgi:hypothetical protein